MKRKMKRNLMVLAVVFFVSAAAYLNWNYAQDAADVGKILGESTLVNGTEENGEEDETAEQEVFNAKNYFDTARLNRQEARDSATALLRETMEDEKAGQEARDTASQNLQKIGDAVLKESTIENLVLAKGYEDCVAFLSEDGVSVVLSEQENGLENSDIAKVMDIVMEETELSADKIKITEAK